MNNVVNIKNAKLEYIKSSNGKKGTYDTRRVFSAYSPAYTVTNEDIRWVASKTKDDARRVLTVAGSGDHPLFYTLNGANEVDTFDISFCAKAVMDIKTAAIKKLNRQEYIKLILQAHKSDSHLSIPYMSKIIDSLPEDSAHFIKEMDGYYIFDNGLSILNHKDKIPTKEEYEKMSKLAPKSFNFIWTGIDKIHSKIAGEYDLINLSNIFEYMNEEQIQEILLSLRPHIKKNQYIIVQTGNWAFSENSNIFYNIKEKFKDWAKMGYLQKDKNNVNSEIMVLLQRTR